MSELDRTMTAWAIVALAERQAGVIRRGQLEDLGLDKDDIGRRLADARLHRVHRGTYAVGHRLLPPEGAWRAAIWAVRGSVLSHWSAAAFHGWVEQRMAEQHVSTINQATSREGLVVHRVKHLYAADVARHGDIAVTTEARTIVDLASVLPWAELRAIADRVRTLDVPAIRDAWARASHRGGGVNVRRLCERLEAHTKSEFERRFLRFCRRYGVPLPEAVNKPLRGFTVDCSYADLRLVVELDGRAFHARRDQMRIDRRRDRKLLGARYATVRLVWEDLDPEEAAETAADLLEIFRNR